ncbi:SMI1/KNR4 family protein [Amycolatopsis sp. NPDC049253]|uniref:SMI1/KNR4 family protein n=1 Tax=Amycolatopsis sp. NPDC049253 TaxID=3155274 RepID=UPI00341C26B9
MIDWTSVLKPEPHNLRLRSGASAGRLAVLDRALGTAVPPQLRDLLAFSDGFEDLTGQWECAWSCRRLATENTQAWQSTTLPRALLAFGDDGAGTCFCVHTDPNDHRVARWSWIGQDSEATYTDLPTFWHAWLHTQAEPG